MNQPITNDPETPAPVGTPRDLAELSDEQLFANIHDMLAQLHDGLRRANNYLLNGHVLTIDRTQHEVES